MIPTTFTQRGVPMVDPGLGSAMWMSSSVAGDFKVTVTATVYEDTMSVSTHSVASQS